jgi:hypothetical protein
VLAPSPLTIRSKQKSAAVSVSFSFVAEQGISAGLPLQVDARPKQKRTVRAPADGAGGDVEGLLS